jgi:hypothetical protein
MTIPRAHVHRCWARPRLTALGLAVALVASSAPVGAQGNTRELVCRGSAGLPLKVELDPSPRDTASVVMSLDYRRPTTLPGSDLRKLEPGTCSWNPYGFPGFPVEPGRVRFDVRRQGQPWLGTGTRIMDTTVGAARFFPDPITLPRYLNDPSHYWKFYVDDVTNLSYSYTSMFDDGLPTYVTITGPVQLANDVRRDLLCRGGTTGLLWGGGASAGNNLAKVQLSYRVSPTLPGQSGGGLAPGSCAWTNRTAMPPEPGKIWFTTSSNAQLKQTQSGVPLDRSPTAAERYPDMRSIPEYLKDPAHFWQFAVVSRAPDSAVTNGVWKPNLTNLVAGALRTTATSTTRSQPSNLPGGGAFQPGGAGSTSTATTVFDIRNVSVTPGLEGVAIRFDAAPNITPTVTLTPDNGGTAIRLAVGSAPNGTMWRYSAASTTKLARNTKYAYRIDAPATAQARANTTSGAFKTLGQFVRISITRIDILSDGDTDGDGDFGFRFEACPFAATTPASLGSWITDYLQWSEGPHPVDLTMENTTGTAPDRFRLVGVGADNDMNVTNNRRRGATISCTSPNVPEKNESYEWNYVEIEFDLTKYPGAKAGDSFVRRSKPLANGSRVSFEIRGSLLVTRQ